MHPLNLRRSPKDYKVTFNRNMTLETGQITLSVNEMENNLSAPLLSVGTSTLGPSPFSIYLHNQKQKMLHPHAFSQWTVNDTNCAQNKDDSFQCRCCKESVWEGLAFSTGSSRIIWHRYNTVVQSKARRGTSTQKLYTSD